MASGCEDVFTKSTLEDYMEIQRSLRQERRTYQWVDVVKFVFCVCVIVMHSNVPLPGVYWIEKLLFRLAVPFFFAASGFFLSKSCRVRGTGVAVKRYCLRLLQLLAFFSVAWILQFWIDCAISKTGLVNTLVQTIQHILFYPNNALWYIQASIVAALLLIPFLRRNWISAAIPLGLVLYAFALLCNNYYFLIENTAFRPVIDWYFKVFLAPHNGVFVGFLYLTLGAYTEGHAQKIQKRLLGILLSVCYLVYAAEVFLVRRFASFTDDGAFYAAQTILVPVLLAFLTRLPANLNLERTVQLRHLSTGMYLLHLPLMWCYHRFCTYCLSLIPVLKRGQGILMNGYVKCVVILLLSWAICMIAYRQTNKLKKYLM